MKSIMLAKKNSAFCFLLIAAAYPMVTQQELIPGSRMSSVGLENTSKAARLSSLIHRGTTSIDGFRQQAAAVTTGNITLDNIRESLVKLEENLTSLIQSFLTVQRSVFNLEQLQELLVLLLEDILKQTGSADKIPVKDTNPLPSGSNTGGTSLINESNDSDSSDIKSVEKDEEFDDQVATTPGDNVGPAEANNMNSRRRTGSDLAASPVQATHERMSGFSKDINVVSTKQGIHTSASEEKTDSAGDSSEDVGSSSNENYSGPRTGLQINTLPADIPIFSSQKPQWSEPVMVAHTSTNAQTRFFDTVQRIASRLGQLTVRNPSPRLLGLTQIHHTPKQQAESTFDRPPIYQPLEIIPAHHDFGTADSKLHPEMLPLKVKLRQESVISHGSPLTGPEQHSSLFLEHAEEHEGLESAGERPTGMINNLMESNTSQTIIPIKEDGNRSITQASVLSMQSGRQTLVPDIRKKRQVHRNAVDDIHMTTDNSPDVLMMLRDYRSERRNGSSTVNNKTYTTKINNLNVNTVSVPESQVNKTEEHFQFAQNETIVENFSQIPGKPIKQHNTTGKPVKQHITSKPVIQEYDVLIASLLTNLRTKLHQQHVKQAQSHVTKDNEISHVDSELDKLIWIPADDIDNSQTESNVVKESIVNKETEGYDNTNISAGNKAEALHRFTNEGNILSERLTEQFASSNMANNSATPKAIKLVMTQADSIMSNNYAVSDSKVHTRIGPSGMKSTPTTNITEIMTETNTNNGSDLQNMENSTYTDWAWLRMLVEIMQHPDVDRVWLVETLTQLSNNVDFDEEFKVLNDSVLALLARVYKTGEFKHSVDMETNVKVNNLTQDDTENFTEDNKSTATEDSSEDIDDNINEEITGSRNIDRREVDQLSDTNGNLRTVNDKHDEYNSNTDHDGSDDKYEGSNSEDSHEGGDSKVGISINVQDNIKMTVYDRGYASSRTFDFINESASTQQQTLTERQISKIEVPFKLSHTGTNHQLLALADDDNINHSSLQFHERQQRSVGDLLNTAISVVKSYRDQRHNQTSLRRQKRQSGILWYKTNLTNPDTKLSIDHQQSNTHARQPNDQEGVITRQKETNVSLSQQPSTESSASIIQSASPNTINADLHNSAQQINSRQTDSSSHRPYSNNERQYSQHNTGNSNDSHLSNPLDHEQRSSDGLPNFLSHLGNNNPYLDPSDPSATDLGESPSTEERSAMDFEEILSSIFMSYWQRFYNLYTRSMPSNSSFSDIDFDEEAAAATLTTTMPPASTAVLSEFNTNSTSADSAAI